MRTEMIYEDREVCVVYKPAGFAAQTSRVGEPDVDSELRKYLCQKGKQPETSAPYLGVIHRLDQPVEGLMVFAKNKKAAASLSGQLQKQGDEGTFHKQYYAVLCGRPSAMEGELVDFLYKNKENRVEVSGQHQAAGAKRAVLRYRILQVRDMSKEHNTIKLQQESVSQEPTDLREPEASQKPADSMAGNGKLALAEIRILTGRFHQIRAQMAHAGMPLLGDLKYGDEEVKAISQELDVQSVALCAYSLEFLHPVSKKKMSFHIEPRGRAFSFFEFFL